MKSLLWKKLNLISAGLFLVVLCNAGTITALARETDNQAVLKQDAKHQKTEAEIAQQLKELVLKQRTERGWLGDGTVSPGVRTFKDISYIPGGTDANQKLDLYIPSISSMGSGDSDEPGKTAFSSARQNLSKGWPLVVWIHGGGWSSGDKKGGPFKALSDAGFAVASINYRLSGTNKWPAQLEDCRSALMWLRKNAAEHNLDPKRISIWGASAGGQLALMLALTGDSLSAEGQVETGKSDLVAVCDWFGPTDLASYLKSNYKSDIGTKMVKDLFGTTDDALLEAAKSASPINYVNTRKSLPPLLIMHGQNDKLVLIKESEDLVKALKSAGHKNISFEKKSGGHGYPGFGSDTINDVIEYLKMHSTLTN